MSNAKHTPGPWTAHNGHTVSFVNSTAPGVSKDGGEATITMLMGGQHGATVEELQANAKLIAAAPDLLEIASAILVRMDLEPVSAQFPASAMREDLRRAIAKATK